MLRLSGVRGVAFASACTVPWRYHEHETELSVAQEGLCGA